VHQGQFPYLAQACKPVDSCLRWNSAGGRSPFWRHRFAYSICASRTGRAILTTNSRELTALEAGVLLTLGARWRGNCEAMAMKRSSNGPSRRKTPGRSKTTIALAAFGAAVLIYVLAAYVLLPRAWTHYEHQKGLAGFAMVTHTSQGIPGDAINVGLVGTMDDVLCAMHTAGWYPADSITFRSSVEIVGSVILRRPYRDAPVSNLYYEGRRQDLAFEKPVGASADRRHHVRFWKV